MKEKILIVEDEKDIIKMLEYNLKKEGFKVIVAQDGEDALDAALRQYPDLILLDLMLPGMDGLEVCKSLKKESKTSLIPIIMLTAKDRSDDIHKAKEVGANGYIVKPFEAATLLFEIKSLLDKEKI